MWNARLIALIAIVLPAVAQDTAAHTWSALKARREAHTGWRQEFDVSREYRRASGNVTTRHRLTLTGSGQMWREQVDARIVLYDGATVSTMDEGGDEVVRRKDPKPADLLPPLYRAAGVDWSKLSQSPPRPCYATSPARRCVSFDLPVKPWIRGSGRAAIRMFKGAMRLTLVEDTGLLAGIVTDEEIQTSSETYRLLVSYSLKSTEDWHDATAFAGAADGRREVKQLSPWRAARILKQFRGKPAPELVATDMAGNPVSLAALRGKTVLLDFWASWCPPCRTDRPDLERLHEKYGDRELVIIGVSVGEDRRTVESFLGQRRPSFANVLSAENALPRHYQVEAVPTYVVIDAKGNLSAATEGDQGFYTLRRLLKSAGLDVD